VAAVFVVAVALIAGLIVRARNAMQPRIRLPDGSILRVAKVDYGEMHEFYRGSESLQKAGEFVTEHLPFYYALPSGIRHPFERMTSYVGSGFSRGGNSLAVWIWHQPGTSASLDIKGAELLDDATGQCLDFSDFENRNSTVSPSHVSFSVLPRRQPTLTIRILAGDQSRLLTIENPFARRKFPEWHPAALPQSKRVAEIDMTMRGWDSFRDGTAANQLNFFALIDIRVEGGLRNDWFRSYPSTEDATGNSGSRLPLSESAWKVSVRTVRTADHPLVRARSDTLADIPIPLPGTVVEIPLTDALRKRGFVYAAVHGHGRFWFVDGQCLASGVMDEKVPEPVTAMRNWSYSSVFGPSLLLVAAPGSAAARSITWVIEDQDGQRLEDYYYQSNERSDDGYVICKQQFRPLPASRTFKAVIGDPGKEYSAEFIAPPPRWPR
jgi:hypothetical protein